MVDIFTNPKSPFFKSAMTISVANIPDDEFAPFLIERFKTGKRIAESPTDSYLSTTKSIVSSILFFALG